MATASLTSVGAPAAYADRYVNRYIIAISVTLASIMELIDTSIVNVAIPHMMGNLGATLDQIAWVSTGYIVANVIVLPITGWLSEVFGRRRYFAGSIALFTAASFLCGNSHSLAELVMWRVLQGLGGGALLSTSQAVLYEVFPPAEYGTAMAIFGGDVARGLRVARAHDRASGRGPAHPDEQAARGRRRLWRHARRVPLRHRVRATGLPAAAPGLHRQPDRARDPAGCARERLHHGCHRPPARQVRCADQRGGRRRDLRVRHVADVALHHPERAQRLPVADDLARSLPRPDLRPGDEPRAR